MSAARINATQIGDGPVHWAAQGERDGGHAFVALCGVTAPGYTVFRGVTCPRCIEVANTETS
jgi:hypothetical protein